MRVIILEIIVFFIFMGEARAQIELKFGQFDTRVPDKSFLDNENLNLKKPAIILEYGPNISNTVRFVNCIRNLTNFYVGKTEPLTNHVATVQ